VEAIKKISEYVAQLRRVGKGHGKKLLFSSTQLFLNMSFPSGFNEKKIILTKKHLNALFSLMWIFRCVAL